MARTRKRAEAELWIEWVPVDELVAWPGNPKDHDVAEIRASMRRHGYVDPAVKDERTGRLVAGHGRAEALLEMREDGEEPPARVRVLPGGRWAMPVLRGVSWDDEAEAEAYVVGANRTVERGGWRDDLLLPILERLRARDDGLAGVGYRASDVDEVLERIRKRTEAPEQFPEVDEDVEQTLLRTVKCPSCEHKFKV